MSIPAVGKIVPPAIEGSLLFGSSAALDMGSKFFTPSKNSTRTLPKIVSPLLGNPFFPNVPSGFILCKI